MDRLHVRHLGHAAAYGSAPAAQDGAGLSDQDMDVRRTGCRLQPRGSRSGRAGNRQGRPCGYLVPQFAEFVLIRFAWPG